MLVAAIVVGNPVSNNGATTCIVRSSARSDSPSPICVRVEVHAIGASRAMAREQTRSPALPGRWLAPAPAIAPLRRELEHPHQPCSPGRRARMGDKELAAARLFKTGKPSQGDYWFSWTD